MSLRHGIRGLVVAALAGEFLFVAAGRPQESAEAGVIKNPAAAEFAKVPGLPDCFTMAAQHGDPNKGPSTLLIKGTAGCAVPWHWHTPIEQVMMVSGGGRAQMKDGKAVVLRPGGYAFLPSHHVHRFACVGPCMAYLYSDGVFDLHYVDETGNEILPEQALKARGMPEPRK